MIILKNQEGISDGHGSPGSDQGIHGGEGPLWVGDIPVAVGTE
jgi:hypothetical protein